jgi:hypothetical protein
MKGTDNNKLEHIRYPMGIIESTLFSIRGVKIFLVFFNLPFLLLFSLLDKWGSFLEAVCSDTDLRSSHLIYL